jgi:hypothetical protein
MCPSSHAYHTRGPPNSGAARRRPAPPPVIPPSAPSSTTSAIGPRWRRRSRRRCPSWPSEKLPPSAPTRPRRSGAADRPRILRQAQLSKSVPWTVQRSRQQRCSMAPLAERPGPPIGSAPTPDGRVDLHQLWCKWTVGQNYREVLRLQPNLVNAYGWLSPTMTIPRAAPSSVYSPVITQVPLVEHAESE